MNDCLLLLEKPKCTDSQEKNTTKSTMSKIKHGIGARCTIFNKIIHNITLNTFNNNGVQVIFYRTLFWIRKHKIKYATEFSCWKNSFVAYLQIWFRQCSPWHFKVFKLSLNSWNNSAKCWYSPLSINDEVGHATIFIIIVEYHFVFSLIYWERKIIHTNIPCQSTLSAKTTACFSNQRNYWDQ